MSNCRSIQSLIDEADQPAALPFEASSHIASCAPCQTFADQRARLRDLLGAMPRVSTPAGFDARLKARLAEARTPGSLAKPFAGPFAWLSPAGYQRFAAAAAVLVIAVFAAQYSGLLSSTQNSATGQASPELATANATSPAASSSIPKAPAVTAPAPPPTPLVSNGGGTTEVAVRYQGGRRQVRATPVDTPGPASADEMYVPMVMVQRNNGTSSVPMLPVSVGAQQRMMSRSGNSSITPAGVSF